MSNPHEFTLHQVDKPTSLSDIGLQDFRVKHLNAGGLYTVEGFIRKLASDGLESVLEIKHVGIHSVKAVCEAIGEHCKRETFASTEAEEDSTAFQYRNSRFVILRWIIEEEPMFDKEVLPMLEIQFEDGLKLDAFPEEVIYMEGEWYLYQ